MASSHLGIRVLAAPVLALLIGLLAIPASAQRSAQIVRAPSSVMDSFTYDLATGQSHRRDPVQRTGAGLTSNPSCEVFYNGDISSNFGYDEGNGATEWIDTGIVENDDAVLVTEFAFTYYTAALDPISGGAGAACEISFRSGYTKGGKGGEPDGIEVARFQLTGMPGHNTASSILNSGSAYSVYVPLPPDQQFCMPAGSIGVGWRFMDLGTDGVWAATCPLLACIDNCMGPGPASNGVTNCMDAYSPPGSLDQTFSFGGSYNTSMVMSFTGTECSDCVLENGSFEIAPFFPNWFWEGGSLQYLGIVSQPDNGFPTDGMNYFILQRPYEGPGVPSLLSQHFSWPKYHPVVQFDAAFVTDGIATQWRMSVIVSDGTTNKEVFHLDSNEPTPLVSQVYGHPMTSIRTGEVDLTSLFPQATDASRMKISVAIETDDYGGDLNVALADHFRFSKLSDVWVDFTDVGGGVGTTTLPFCTLTEAVTAVADDGLIQVQAGSSSEVLTIDKAVEIRASGGVVEIGAP